MWQSGIMEEYLTDLEANGSPKVYSTAIDEKRMDFITGSKEGVEKLLDNPDGILLEFSTSVETALGKDLCKVVSVPTIKTPTSRLSYPFAKGNKYTLYYYLCNISLVNLACIGKKWDF